MIDVVAEAQVPMIRSPRRRASSSPSTPSGAGLQDAAERHHDVDRDRPAHGRQGREDGRFIGFADAYGEGWYQEFSEDRGDQGITIVANERCNRNDTSVTGQVLKIVAAKPDAVLVAASGTPAVLPQKTLKERGYAGKYYQTHGVANNDFLRVGGKDVDDTYLPPAACSSRRSCPPTTRCASRRSTTSPKYEAAYGKGSVSTFGAHAWDAGVLMTAAIPVALKKAQPGARLPRRAARCAGGREGGPERTASSTCRPATTWAWTSARG